LSGDIRQWRVVFSGAYFKNEVLKDSGVVFDVVMDERYPYSNPVVTLFRPGFAVEGPPKRIYMSMEDQYGTVKFSCSFPIEWSPAMDIIKWVKHFADIMDKETMTKRQ